MRMPRPSQGALMVLIALSAVCPAQAQHRATGGHAQAGHGQATHRGNSAATPQLQKQMEQQYQQAVMQEQAQMAAMAKQAQHAHQQRLQSFNEWAKNGSASPGQSQSGTASHLPQSPAAFAAWYKTQKRNKALSKSYDPAFDQYRDYEKSLQAGAKHRNHSNSTATAHKTQNPQPSTPANAQLAPAVQSLQVRSSASRPNSQNAPQRTAAPTSVVPSTNVRQMSAARASQIPSMTPRSSALNSSNPQQLSVAQASSAQATNPRQLPVTQMTPTQSLNPRSPRSLR